MVSDPFADSTTVASLWEQLLDDRYSDRAFSRDFEESISSPTDQHSLPRLGSPGPSVPSPGAEQKHNLSSVGEEQTGEDRRDSRHLSSPELLPFTLESSLERPDSITSESNHSNTPEIVPERHNPELSVPERRSHDSSASGVKSSGKLRAATSGIRSAIKNLLHRKPSDSNNLFTHTSETAPSSGFLKRWRHRRSESVVKPHIEVELGYRGLSLP